MKLRKMSDNASIPNQRRAELRLQIEQDGGVNLDLLPAGIAERAEMLFAVDSALLGVTSDYGDPTQARRSFRALVQHFERTGC